MRKGRNRRISRWHRPRLKREEELARKSRGNRKKREERERREREREREEGQKREEEEEEERKGDVRCDNVR